MICSSTLALAVFAAGCARTEPSPGSNHSDAGEPLRVDSFELLAPKFVEAVSAGRNSEAYGMLCEPVRRHLSLAAFSSALQENPYFQGAAFDQFKRSNRWGAGSSEGTLRSRNGDIEIELFVSLVGPKGPSWCITGALIGGTPMLPPPTPSDAAGDANQKGSL